MPPGVSAADFKYLLPEIVLTVGSLLVLIADVLLRRGSRVLPWLTIAVLGATAVALVPFANEHREIANGLIARDPTVVAWRDTGITCLRLRAELAANAGARDEALALANQVLAGVRAIDSKSDPFALAQAHKLLGDVMIRSGDRSGAIGAWQAALAAWPKGVAETPSQMATRGELLRGIGDRAEGGRISADLAAKGYRRSLSNRVGI